MKDYMHKEYPKTVGRNEFWKQIKRTVNGKEVSEKDISAIVSQINKHMNFNKQDHLLDLGCGNGALASKFFVKLNQYTGVDFSEYLLDVAQEFFCPNNVQYKNDSAENFILNCHDPEQYSKVLIYGVMSYFERDDIANMISTIDKKFKNVSRIFIGNIPNKEKAKEFYAIRDKYDFDLNDKDSPIGIWWHPSELINISSNFGFNAEIIHMPADFYGSQYRFDLILSK